MDRQELGGVPKSYAHHKDAKALEHVRRARQGRLSHSPSSRPFPPFRGQVPLGCLMGYPMLSDVPQLRAKESCIGCLGRDLPRRQQLTGIVTRESATFAWILRVHRRNEAGKTRLDGVSLCDVISPSETGSNPCPGRPAPRLIQTRLPRPWEGPAHRVS